MEKHVLNSENTKLKRDNKKLRKENALLRIENKDLRQQLGKYNIYMNKEVVDLIIEMREKEKKSYRRIAEILNEKCILSKAGRKWGPSSVYTIYSRNSRNSSKEE